MPICRPLLVTFLLGACTVSAQVPPIAPPLPNGELLRRVNALPMPDLAVPSTRELELPSANKISPMLRRLLTAPPAEQGARSIAIGATAGDRRIPAVVQTVSLAQVQLVESEIRNRNGQVDAEFENTIWARIPPASVTALAESPQVRSVTVQPEDRIEQESALLSRSAGLVGDGIRAAHLQLLQNRGLSGRGIKIGILDLGFAGYSQMLKAGRVRAARAQKSFPLTHGVENHEMHGSACAEIISVAAPGSELYLASFDGRQGHMVEAALWLLAQGVQVISYSAGNTEAPNDGSDVISRFVDYTTRRFGVLWVVAAGNHAQKHWKGFSETNREGLIETTRDGMTGLEITALTNHLRIVVQWDDWGPDPRAPSATQDIDAYLLAQRDDGKGLYVVQQSIDIQNGGAALPLEVIELSGPDLAGRQFVLRLKAKRVTRRLLLHVFLDSEGRVYPSVPSGSILNPASARSALAVGGIDVLTNELAKYSSQGPTDDNRLKPEVSAPTNTVSWAYASTNGRFPGTSASCPHVAGFAALLREQNPRITASELRLLIMRAVVPRGAPQPNALYGYGQIDGGSVPTIRGRGFEPTSAKEGSIAIPPEFGGAISRRALVALRDLANNPHDGLRVRVVSGRDLYRIGDGLRLGFHATDDCSCLLFVRDAGGNYSVLQASEAKFLALHKGQLLLLPGAEDETLEIDGPPGTDELLLVCSSHPIDLNSVPAAWYGNGLAISTHSYMVVGNE